MTHCSSLCQQSKNIFPIKHQMNPGWWDGAMEGHLLINKDPIKATTKGNIVIVHQEVEKSSIFPCRRA